MGDVLFIMISNISPDIVPGKMKKLIKGGTILIIIEK